MKNTMKPIQILLVEDSEGDIRLIQEAFKEGKILNNLSISRNGEEAIDFLFRRKGFEDSPKPDLILLDLNLPKKNGRVVLSEIKNDHNLKKIPVVILTTSSSEGDIISTYDLHANCYIVKPMDMNRFIDVIKSIEDYWFTIVKLPDGE
jgi:CheY-like chemotaxis protein